MEAAGEAPLAHHETEWQHEQSTDTRHDVGDGHKSGLVCLGDVVAAVLQVDAMERALHRGRAELIVNVAGANSKADTFLLSVKDHIEALHDDSTHNCPSARL